MKGWLKSRLELPGFSLENFQDATGISGKTLDRWDKGEVGFAKVNQQIIKISDYFDERIEDLIKAYEQSKIDNLPDYLHFLANLIDSFEECPLFKNILLDKLKASDTYEIVKKTDQLISKNTKAQATQEMIAIYSDAIDLLITQHEDLHHVEELVACLALVCANQHPEFDSKSYISIRLESEFDDEIAEMHAAWSIQMMIDKDRASPLVSTLITKGSYLDTKGAVIFPSDLTRLTAEIKSDTDTGLQKELYGWVKLIASKLGDPMIKIPELTEEDFSKEKNGNFWRYAPILQAKIGSRNNTANFIFATVKDTVPPEMSDLVLEYFTPQKAGEEENPTLRLYQLSKENGCSSYQLDLGIFTEWIKDRLTRIEKQKIENNSRSLQKNFKRGTDSEGQVIGQVTIEKVENLAMLGDQDNRSVVINHYNNNLEELRGQLNNSQVDHGLNHTINELRELDPETTDKKEQEKIKALWSRIKAGVDKFNATSKTVTAFHKAYETACKLSSFLENLQ